jgi:hypothetical protein
MIHFGHTGNIMPQVTWGDAMFDFFKGKVRRMGQTI